MSAKVRRSGQTQLAFYTAAFTLFSFGFFAKIEQKPTRDCFGTIHAELGGTNIPPEIDDNCPIHYPIRTAVCDAGNRNGQRSPLVVLS
jgi:hypothetical protein